jgi:hypothetical protein
MRLNECVEIRTTKVNKLRTNFKNELFDQYEAFKEGDKVSITMTLVHLIDDKYFYKMSIKEKLNRV